MVSLYDKAILQKLNKWTEKAKLQVYGPEDIRRIFEITADETKDKPIKFPIIALRRENGYTITNTAKNETTYRGKITDKNIKTTVTLRQIPISIDYVLDIYSTRFEDVDIIAKEFVFNIMNNHTCTFVIPYNGIEIPQKFNLSLGEDVEDTSDIPNIAIKQGQLWRMSIHIQVNDAHLFDVKVKENVTDIDVGLTLKIYSSETDVIEEKIDIDFEKEK